MADNAVSGSIFNIQRFCVSDGPGIRTTVFFQGCPLKCPWCHNPESHPFAPHILFHAEKCIACGRCVKPGGGAACVRRPDEPCTACGICEKECPAGAITLLGRRVSVEDVMQEVRKDAFYYRRTGGGLTLSGGEPLARPEFAAALLECAKKENIHTAVETSGAVPQENLARILPFCDLFLFDVKTVPEKYRRLIGADPENVFSNLRFLSGSGAKIRLRVPLVQNWNAEDSLLEFLLKLRKLPGVEGVDLLPYHDMGRMKASMAGLPEPDWTAMSAPPPELLKRWEQEL